MENLTKYAIIVAGGIGSRMGSNIPKQYLTLRGQPIFIHSIKAFLNADPYIKIILVVSNEFQKNAQQYIKEFLLTEEQKRIEITIGGETRFHSVNNGLQCIHKQGIVAIHDAVRCLVSSKMINNCYYQAQLLGSAIPAVTATDSIRIADKNENHAIDRSTIKIIQTPQTFKTDLILKAFKSDYNNNFTDEASVVEFIGEKVHLIDGDYNNIKITRPLDLIIAENILGNE
ncbi:2-C-methyl-D-erythritol 4-phosphate cytidylyltransferase [Rhizosphaericola mali]|uniref:2-C-methyl-D-erythritol 4-phosphate cytidylyltransferase n=1 Tax=Rhizosphaericola mali TaxID=2545455 RepID=UPI001CD96940|nr:2-C-methyl-D-erythritol 4-phosphate cytidylyltransferase [Rhizosphaericola mali]